MIWDKYEKYGRLSRWLFKRTSLLLADVFEKFVATCLKFHKLDPCHYFSSPGLSWDATLKMTDVKLEKISNIDKYLLIEKWLRGGILTLLRDVLKQVINTWMIIILKSSQHLYHTLT